ncbi:MAG: hypothetical protein ACM31C_13975, partial [Acidobacteriota bacterium]
NVMSDLKDEGEATITNIEVKKELAAAGVNINVAGVGGAKYEELAKKYPDPKDRDKLREEIAKQFGSTEVPSVPKADGTMYKDYNAYYSENYQKTFDQYAKDNPKEVHAVDVRAGLDDKMAKMKDLKPDQKALVDARLAGLKGDDLIKETDAIDRALSGPNADRALATYSDLARLAGDKKAKERLTPEMISMLVTGVGDRRTDSDRGQAGVLGGMQAKDAATALVNMPDDDYKKMVGLLNGAGKDDKGKDVAGADAHAEQSLILKTIAARRDKWDLSTWKRMERFAGIGTDADKADNDISEFAKDIRGEKRADLIRETTLMDVDDVNASKKDPDHLASGDNDTTTDNDGLYQRFGDSCAVTTQQILRGEMDPIYARKLQKQGLDNPDPDSEISKQQEQILEKYKGSSTLRLGSDARTNLTGQLNKAKLDPDKALLVNQLMNGNVTDLAKQKAALDEVRAKNDGHPTDAEVKAMQYNSSHSGSTGVWQGDAAKDLTNDVTHLTLQEHNITDGVGNHLDNIDGLLKSGQPVPFNVAWTGGGAHAMMMTDVRTGADGSRTYLVTDPWTGATRWVGQKDLSDGTWYQKTFGGGTSTVQDIVADKDQKV